MPRPLIAELRELGYESAEDVYFALRGSPREFGKLLEEYGLAAATVAAKLEAVLPAEVKALANGTGSGTLPPLSRRSAWDARQPDAGLRVIRRRK